MDCHPSAIQQSQARLNGLTLTSTHRSLTKSVISDTSIFAPSSGRYTLNAIAHHLRTPGELKTPPQQSSSSQIPTDGQARMPSTEELLARREIPNRMAMDALRKWRKEKEEASKRLGVEKCDEGEEDMGASEGTESCTGGVETAMSGEDGLVEEGGRGVG
jgi:hypothetical protein